MRTDYSIRNSFSAFFSYIVTLIFGFVCQSIFVKVLGIEYLGINGLFTNVLTLLSLFEMGISTAILYNLYSPIAKNDIEKIKSLMNMYKKAYKVIGFLILVIGLLILPFITKIVGNVTVDINIYIVYLLFLIQNVLAYFLTYKRSLIYANQRNYIINYVHSICYIVLNIGKILIIYVTKNYYLYLIISLLLNVIENIVLNIIANKLYPYLLDKNVQSLDKTVSNDIYERIKAIFFHKIGAVVVGSTDNIIISSFLGVVTVGLYSNYSMIIGYVNSLIYQILNAISPSVGNLIVNETKYKVYSVFKKTVFINFWLTTFASVSLLLLLKPFVSIWLGPQFLIDNYIVWILILNCFQGMMRYPFMIFKDSGGIVKEDWFVPLIESVLNIGLSIVLLKRFGLAGVFMGTIASSLILWFFSYPKYVYKKLFNGTYKQYYFGLVKYTILFVIITFICYFISSRYIFSSALLQLFVNTIICLTIPNLLLFVIYYKTEDYKYFKGIFIAKVLNKMLKK